MKKLARFLLCVIVVASALLADGGWGINKGELYLSGIVKSVDARAKSFVMTADLCAVPSSRPGGIKIKPPRPKLIKTTGSTYFACYSGKTTFATLRSGIEVIVKGKDSGKGTPLKARSVWMKASPTKAK